MAEEKEKKEEKKPETKATSEKKEELSPLQKLLKKSDVLMMLYPKDEDGYFSENIQAKDEIIIYKGSRLAGSMIKWSYARQDS